MATDKQRADAAQAKLSPNAARVMRAHLARLRASDRLQSLSCRVSQKDYFDGIWAANEAYEAADTESPTPDQPPQGETS
jgi:hypothetical protein